MTACKDTTVMNQDIEKDILYIVMPAYNEEDNIELVVKQWYPLLERKAEKSRMVIADYGSSDRTHEILLKLRETEYPKLEILDTHNQFHGPKVLALYRYAISQGADYIFQTDSDGQTDPGEFRKFWELRNEYDGIFGNRTIRGDGQSRAFVEKVVCLLLYIYFGVKIPDANAPFRLMKAETVNKYLSKFMEDYALPNIMITTYFSYYRERMLFQEITFKPRLRGNNSINFKKIIKIGWKSLKDFAWFRKDMKSAGAVVNGGCNEEK